MTVITAQQVVVEEELTVEEGGEIVLESGSGYPDYRTYSFFHPADARDRIHYISSYNLRYDQDTATWMRPDSTKAGFHLGMESEWERTIEWNFDFTTALNDTIHRAMEVRINMDSGNSYWLWRTDPTNEKRVRFGMTDPALARWEGDSASSMMRWEVQNFNSMGGAEMSVSNSAGLRGALQLSAPGLGHTTFGLPYANTFFIHGTAKMVVGTSAAQPLYFITDSTVRGGVQTDGTWYQRRQGKDYPIPHDAVPWSTLFPPMRAGSYYQPQFGGTRGTAVLPVNTVVAAPFAVPRETDFNQLAIEITTAAAGSTVRLGIYADDGEGRPGALVRDAGTVDAATAGLKVVPGAFTLPAGLYWVAAAARGGSPATRVLTGGGGWMVPQPATGDDVHNAYTGTHAADALATPFPVTGTAAAAPLVLLRAA